MYGQAADARREPSPPASRRGYGKLPEASPSQGWGFTRTLSSFLGWSNKTPALTPLSLSGPHASDSHGHADGEVHHQPVTDPDTQSNVVAQLPHTSPKWENEPFDDPYRLQCMGEAPMAYQRTIRCSPGHTSLRDPYAGLSLRLIG